ncbi:MAG: hypothetical protein FWE32_11360 [Oscillospiraceae bacterium]|nr:hypothetical protein [Oscillospiraceae bacterium]
MKPADNNLTFLLGANTPSGFVSRFDQLAAPAGGLHTYIIKGGPGCGKSTLIRKVAAAFADQPGLETIVCSSDADSLDGLIVPTKKFCIVDGTRPHLLDPAFPGAVESMVDLTCCWDAGALENRREEIIGLAQNITRAHEYCCRYLAAGAALLSDSHRLTLESLNTQKLNDYLTRLTGKELSRKGKGTGREQVRFMTALTNKGIVKYTKSAKALAGRIYLISDEVGAVSRLILHRMRADALAGGYDIISCYCPLSPFDKLEQLFIPALSLGFLTSNRFHNFDLELTPYRIINSARFTHPEPLKAHKRRMTYNRKAAAEMISQAHGLMAEAKTLHDELEGYYTAAINFKKVDALTENLIAKLQSRA